MMKDERGNTKQLQRQRWTGWDELKQMPLASRDCRLDKARICATRGSEAGTRYYLNGWRGDWLLYLGIADGKGRAMDSNIRKQVRNGLRLGAGVGGFLIALILIGIGVDRIAGSAGSHQITGPDWVGWAELAVAVAILLPTARVWLVVLAGYLLFGAIKGFFLFAAGCFPSQGFSSRVEPLEVALFAVLSLLSLYRFSDSPPTVLDRIALTVYLLCLVALGNRFSSTFSSGQLVGLGVLLGSWCVARLRVSRHRRVAHL